MFGPVLRIGQMVHYVMRTEDFGPGAVYPAQAQGGPAALVRRPALIVETWNNEHTGDQKKWSVNLLVFVDGKNDGYPSNLPPDPPATPPLPPPFPVPPLLWRTSVPHDEEVQAGGTWHWPEK
jgi:hypothetical protein